MRRGATFSKRLGMLLPFALFLGGPRCGPRTLSETVQAGSQKLVRTCGTPIADERELDAVDREVDRRLGVSHATRTPRGRPGITTIGVYAHVITAAGGTVGDVSDRLREQVNALNAGYSGAEDAAATDTGFRFRLMGHDVTDNDDWFYNCASLEGAIKEALYHASPADTQNPSVLHVYTCDADGYLGWAYYPWSVVGTPYYYYDGLVLHYQSLPGGAFVFDNANEPDGVLNYASGDTSIHEVGHWIGLAHTFEAGCSSKNDDVDDTPAERKPAFYCAPRDSCSGPQSVGPDPIHNYMDYTDDDCMTHFTTGQGVRARAIWDAYRAQ